MCTNNIIKQSNNVEPLDTGKKTCFDRYNEFWHFFHK